MAQAFEEQGRMSNPEVGSMVEDMAAAMMAVARGRPGLEVAEAVMQSVLVILLSCAPDEHVPEVLRNGGDYLHRVADHLENQQARQPAVLQ